MNSKRLKLGEKVVHQGYKDLDDGEDWKGSVIEVIRYVDFNTGIFSGLVLSSSSKSMERRLNKEYYFRDDMFKRKSTDHIAYDAKNKPEVY